MTREQMLIEGTPAARLFAVPHAIPQAPFVELKQSLQSEVDAITPFVARLMRLIVSFTGDKWAQPDLEVALREALLNAVVHGNQGDPDKRVYVTCRCGTDGEISIAIRDQGQGFDYQHVAGRGICLMRGLMDYVSFADEGRIVYMSKKPLWPSSPCVQ